MIQGTCGRTYFDCSDPTGPLSLWESRLRERLAMVGSTECALVWREKTTPAGQSISRLSRSTVLTNGTGNTGSLWPTPTVADVTGGRKARGGARSSEPLLNGLLFKASPWVTPSARDWKDSAGMATDRPDGGSRIDQLPRQMIAVPWPTVKASAVGPDPESRKTGVSIQTVMAAWPTVTVHGNFSARGAKGCSDQAGDGICTVMVETAHGGPGPTGSSAMTAKRVGSPTPAHPCWLMGYEAAWLYLAPQNSARPRTRKKSAG